ncbi:hypothetical protein GCM10023176_15500 [Micromonospora coerulea]|uniref:Uncharacterized protein n=1 Tax=Micromonospora coerulea TaxID=47856 RepID=A0ABP8SE74_9ACTN
MLRHASGLYRLNVGQDVPAVRATRGGQQRDSGVNEGQTGQLAHGAKMQSADRRFRWSALL